MPTERLRVLIADDHPMFRTGLRALLSADQETEVLGEATTGEEVVALAATLRPDVILHGYSDAGHERHRGDAPDPARLATHPYPDGDYV